MGSIVDAAARLEETLVNARLDIEYDPGVQQAMRSMIELLKGIERTGRGESRRQDRLPHFHYFLPHETVEGFEVCVEDPRERGSIGCGVIRETGRYTSGLIGLVKGERDGLVRSCPWCGDAKEGPQMKREADLREKGS